MMYASAWIFDCGPTIVSFSIRATAPDDDAVADRDPLAHARLVSEDHVDADGGAREDDRARRDDRPLPDERWLERLARRGRARRQRRLLADDGMLEDANSVAEHRARMHDRRRVDLSRHAATS